MADNSAKPSEAEEAPAAAAAGQPSSVEETGGGGGGWGGWGFSTLSYLSDLQKVAAVAAEEISRNAVEAAKTAAKSISDTMAEDSESYEEDGTEASAVKEESDDESNELRKAALDRLEKASEDSFLSQGLRALDTSVESFTSGAWQALGTAWKEGANLVHKIEDSASNFTGSTQDGGLPGPTGSLAPSLLETGKALSAKGMQVLELVGKETMDLLISETGLHAKKNSKKSDGLIDDDQLFEEVTFDRCFYIYGGPEQLEELEALSNHHALLYNRRKAKLSSENKSAYDGKLKEVQQIFSLGAEIDGNMYLEKGKKIEAGNDDKVDQLRNLNDSSVRKAAELAAGAAESNLKTCITATLIMVCILYLLVELSYVTFGFGTKDLDLKECFASALVGLSPNDIIQRTSGRLDSLHSEGVHRLSEMCCYAVSQLLMLGKSIISNANKVPDQEIEEEIGLIDWPEDSVEKAKIIRSKAQSMTGNMEAVFNSFITGISDVAEAYQSAIKSASTDSQEVLTQKSVQEKASAFTESLRSDHTTALGKMQDGLQYLTFVVLSTSIPSS
ncbi:UNVERIFIED_CONTAM: hypothetical protein Sangu_1065400 [Sesamum angustifolium]|uniref:DUF7798 domain-containing protein n=1 Tax=Sesamum angustifolium TaxID=2727405 RepID=A0AAW2NYT9_9LAMI